MYEGKEKTNKFKKKKFLETSKFVKIRRAV